MDFSKLSDAELVEKYWQERNSKDVIGQCIKTGCRVELEKRNIHMI